MSPSTVRIDWERVSIRFGGRTVLAGFDCAVEPGARIALTGPSGCGKSTLLRAALGFTLPADGSVRIDGETVDALTCWRLRRLVGYLPQEVEIGDGAAREALFRPFAFRANAARRPSPDETVALLERLRLRSDILDAEVANLSGGEKQRLAFAAALLLRRPLLLLDEPTSALDADAREAVRHCLAELPGTTVVAVTHNPDDLAGLWTGITRIPGP